LYTALVASLKEKGKRQDSKQEGSKKEASKQEKRILAGPKSKKN